MSGGDLFLVEMTIYDPDTSGTRTLRYATQGFVTGAAETPASTYYAPRVKQPAVIRRDCYGAGRTTGRSRTGYGDLVLANDDGALDALLNYGFDGRAVTIRRGTKASAYPAGFTTVLVGTMEQPEFGSRTVTVKIRDKQMSVDVPLQTTKYAGNNSLPAGLEGVAADLKGKPKPVLYGVVKNISPPCVNTSKLIYQVNNGAVNSIDAVYDKGVPLGPDVNSFSGGSGLWTANYAARALAWVTDGTNEYLVAVGDNGKISSLATEGGSWTNLTPNEWGTTNIYCLGMGSGIAGGPLLTCILGGDAGTLYSYAVAPPGNGGTVLTSQFGATAIRAICYSAPLHVWVIVGDGGKISSSSDGGATWTSRTSGVATALYGVAYGNGYFVAVGASGVLLYSTDGTTWYSASSPLGTSDMRAVTYAAPLQLFVAVGADNKIAIASNGAAWTLITGALDNGAGGVKTLNALAYSDGVIIAAGEETGVVRSTDGKTWTLLRRTVSANAHPFHAVARWPDGSWWLAGYNTLGTVEAIWRTPAISTYANSTDLLNDALAPAPGSYKTYAAGGYFRLGSPPAGQITADVTQGAAAANRTAAQIWSKLLDNEGAFTAGDWSATDVTALDTANSSVIGFYSGVEEMQLSDALDQVASSVGAWWGVDKDGVFRVQQLTAPSGSPVYTITASLRAPERLSTQDEGRGLPVYRSILRYAKNYTVQTDLAGAVSDDRRAELAAEWREVSSTDATVQTKHLLAPQVVEYSLMSTAANAQTEVNRRQTLRGVRRDRFEVLIPLNDDTDTLDLGNVVKLTYDRFGLTAGKLFRIVGIEPNAAARTLTLSLWGNV